MDGLKKVNCNLNRLIGGFLRMLTTQKQMMDERNKKNLQLTLTNPKFQVSLFK